MENKFRHVILYVKSFIQIISNLPIRIEIGFILAITTILGVIYVLVISPIVFNYMIIPKIERKIGKKLEYHPLCDYVFLGKWMCRQLEIAMYIFNRMLALIFENDYGLPKYCNRFGLKKAGYTIKMASKCEIIMSFVLIFVNAIIILSAFTALIIYPSS